MITYERQMEKTTLYTRQGIIEALSKFIPKLINATLQSKDQMEGKTPREDIEIDVLFGEYSTPSFDAQIETISKAKMNGIMSLETSIDELYGDSKDDEWKAQEIARLNLLHLMIKTDHLILVHIGMMLKKTHYMLVLVLL